jgi:hypothetical protein
MHPLTPLLCMMSSSEAPWNSSSDMAPRTGIARVIHLCDVHATRLHAMQKDEELLLQPEPLASTNHMNWLYVAHLNINAL